MRMLTTYGSSASVSQKPKWMGYGARRLKKYYEATCRKCGNKYWTNMRAEIRKAKSRRQTDGVCKECVTAGEAEIRAAIAALNSRG